MKILCSGIIGRMPNNRKVVEVQEDSDDQEVVDELKFYLKKYYKLDLNRLSEILERLKVSLPDNNVKCTDNYDYITLQMSTGEEVDIYIGDDVEKNKHIRYDGSYYGVRTEKGRVCEVYLKCNKPA